MTHKKALFALLLYFVVLFYTTIRMSSVSANDYFGKDVGPDIEAQLSWIDYSLLRNGGGEKMQSLHPEGYFLTHSLYALTLINQANATNDRGIRQRNLQRLEWLVERLRDEMRKVSFSGDDNFHGAFHSGWFNRVLAGLVSLNEHPSQVVVRDFHKQSEALAKNILKSPTLHIDSYPQMCWPVDNIVALTSLSLHDKIYDSNYNEAIQSWLQYTHKHLDPKTGLIPHRVNSETGEIIEGARGSSTVLALSFLPEIDIDFAESQYRVFMSSYRSVICGFGLIHEYARSTKGISDVDSGPLIFGISPVATWVSLPAAKANGDVKQFESVLALSQVFSLSTNKSRQKKFFLGKLLAADAFLAWGKTLHTVTSPKSFSKKIDKHGKCLVFLVAIPLFLFWIFTRTKSKTVKYS